MGRELKNIDPNEIDRFAAQADSWWDLKGEYKALHEINPVRLAYVQDRADLVEKNVLDIGCGGGLLSEAMADAGGWVTGIDMAGPSLLVARAHAKEEGLSIDYRQSTVERWAQQYPDHYDVVTCMELIEHVPDPRQLIQACVKVVRPGGDLFFATVNRTFLSRILVIWLSEYVFGIVNRGTHTYAKFVQPKELVRWGQEAGLIMRDVSGLRYLPYLGYAALCRSMSMNYLVHFRRCS